MIAYKQDEPILTMTKLDFPTGALPAPHPEFGLAALRSIRLPDNWQNPDTATYLAHCVSRKPGDLMAHARRIALHAALPESPDLAAAVVDLFIALGDKGQSLKQHMLARHGAALADSGCLVALSAAVAGNLSPHLPEVALPGSVLARPASGSFDFVRPIQELSEAETRQELIDEFRRLGLLDEAAELEAES